MAQRTRDTKDTYIGLLAAIVEVNGATSGRTRAILWTVRLPSNRFRKFKTLFKRLREFEFFFFFSSNNLFDPYDQNFQHCIFRKKKEFLNFIHFFFFKEEYLRKCIF